MKNTSLNVWRLIPIFILSLVNLSPSWITGWIYDGANFQESPLSLDHRTSIEPSLSAFIDGSKLCLIKNEGLVEVFECDGDESEPLWQSPEEWEVREAFFSDLNRDGQKELTLLVWRAFQPWPIDRVLPRGGRINTFHDAHDRSCHIILLGLKDGTFVEVWAGSAMADPLHEIYALDLDGDGVEELAGLEYAYDGSDYDSSLVVWEWNGFGFRLEDRAPGSYSILQPVLNQHNILLLVQ